MQKDINAVHRKGSIGLPQDVADYLKAWMMSPEHVSHPYPTEKEKEEIMADTGIGLKQLTNWFVNNRRRYWKPQMIANTEPAASSTSNCKRAHSRNASPMISPLEGQNRNHDCAELRNVIDYDNSSSFTETMPLRKVKKTRVQMGNGRFGPFVVDPLNTGCGRNVNYIDAEANPSLSPTSLSSIHESTQMFLDAACSGYVFTSNDVCHYNNPNFACDDKLMPHHSCVSMCETEDLAMISSGSSCEDDEEMASSSVSSSSFSRKRKYIGNADLHTSITRPSSVNTSSWRDACLKTKNSYEGLSLPSLEEAAILFGFSN